MTTRAATLAALLAVLVRPAWWLLGLAGFLARGGIVLFLVAVVTLPSPLAISDAVSPLLVPFVLGGATAIHVLVVASGVLVVVAWIVLGGWIGAATEVVLIRDAQRAAAEEALPVRATTSPSRWVVARVAVAHLLVHVPVVIVVALGSVRIVAVAYVELTQPGDVLTPLPVRIAAGAAGPIALIVVAWLLGEIAGGVAARRIVLERSSLVRAVGAGWLDLVRQPRSTLVPALATTVTFSLELIAMLAAVGLAWTAARSRLAALPIEPVPLALAVASLAAAWTLALVVAGLIAAWRSVAMTFEAERLGVERSASRDVRVGPPIQPLPAAGADPAGTFGVPADGRPGDWSAGGGGGSL